MNLETLSQVAVMTCRYMVMEGAVTFCPGSDGEDEMKRTASALLLVLLAACAGGRDEASTHKIDGVVSLRSSDVVDEFAVMIDGKYYWPQGRPCSGVGAYADLTEGAQVLILDSAGRTIAKTQLTGGAWGDKILCLFPFSAEVPASDFYRVKVTHRDGPTFSQADLQRDGWKVVLTIG